MKVRAEHAKTPENGVPHVLEQVGAATFSDLVRAHFRREQERGRIVYVSGMITAASFIVVTCAASAFVLSGHHDFWKGSTAGILVPTETGGSTYFYGIVGFLAGFSEHFTGVIFGNAERLVSGDEAEATAHQPPHEPESTH